MRAARRPDFFILGVQKSGTSWLNSALSHHPDVCVPKKEIHFFDNADNYAKGYAWYERFFRGCPDAASVGEATPNYFYARPSERRPGICPALIHDCAPNARFIVLFRDPVERAISAYYHNIQVGRISPAWPLEHAKYQANILTTGYYDEHLGAWLRYFDRDQFLVLFFERHILQRKEHTLRSVYDFLGVDSAFYPPGMDEKKNPRRSHIFMRMRHFYPRVLPYLDYLEYLPTAVTTYLERMAHISVTPEEKQELVRRYAPHVRRLRDEFGLDVPASWLKPLADESIRS